MNVERALLIGFISFYANFLGSLLLRPIIGWDHKSAVLMWIFEAIIIAGLAYWYLRESQNQRLLRQAVLLIMSGVVVWLGSAFVDELSSAIDQGGEATNGILNAIGYVGSIKIIFWVSALWLVPTTLVALYLRRA